MTLLKRYFWRSVLLPSLAIVAIMGPSTLNVILAVGIVSVPVFIRTTRAVAMSTLAEPFVEGSVSLGCSPLRVSGSPCATSQVIVPSLHVVRSRLPCGGRVRNPGSTTCLMCSDCRFAKEMNA